MTYESALIALADPTRRAILDRLRPGPLSVAEIAAPLPVSRPAVSQHLKVMKDAGLLTVERVGARNRYGLAPAGLDEMRQWLDALWEDALASSARGAQQAAEGTALPPVTKSLHVRLTLAEAFSHFTEDMALWWPVSSMSLSADRDGALPMALVFQTEARGQIIETLNDGTTGAWARVVEWAPPRQVTLAWHVGREEAEATQLTVRFDSAGRGTKVTLVHDGWDALGDAADAVRAQYETGWDYVFVERFAASAAAALSNF